MMLIRNTLLRLCFSAGVLSFCAGCRAAGADTVFVQPVRNEWLRAAKELACGVQTMAADEQVAKLYVSDDDVLGCIYGIGTADYGQLQKVTVAEVSGPKLTAGFLNRALATSDTDTAVCRRIAGIMENRLNPAMFVSILNGEEGSTHLAASTILTDSRTYIQPRDWREDLLVVLEYGGEYAVAVAFWQSGVGTVTGMATFIAAGSADRLFVALDRFCGEHIPVRELTGTDLNQASL